jgi:18S rRNA (guanine1575-N7)-methyltransferase
MITSIAMKNGFTGGLIVDFPNSKKAKKYFLFLMAGYSEEIMKDAEKAIMLPKARTEGEGYSDDESSDEDDSMEDSDKSESAEEESAEEDMRKKGEKGEKQISVANKRRINKTIQKAKAQVGRFKPNCNRKSKSWILKKKDRQRRQGVKVKADSKFSGRKRMRF